MNEKRLLIITWKIYINRVTTCAQHIQYPQDLWLYRTYYAKAGQKLHRARMELNPTFHKKAIP
jgi:hypothetical protein